MFVKLENRYFNLAQIIVYSKENATVSFCSDGHASKLTPEENAQLSWFLDIAKGTQTGIFDVADMYSRRDAIQDGLERAKEAARGIGELESKLEETARQFEASTGKKLTPEALAAARKKLQESGLAKVIPIDQRKN